MTKTERYHKQPISSLRSRKAPVQIWNHSISHLEFENFPASVASSNIDEHQDTRRSESPKLTRLLHFGLTYHWADVSPRAEFKTLTTNFAALCGQSFDSISLPISYYSRTREDLDFILEVCASLSHLKELGLVETQLSARRTGNRCPRVLDGAYFCTDEPQF